MTYQRKLSRSQNQVIASVAEYLDWDIALVLILYLIISIFRAAFPEIIVYIHTNSSL
ncbi:MAG: hypothetical protein PWP52_1573 [Bacteroidales bacterium]|jgi:phage shock protein PspC (stress-responsive transcriptional regulator)|nr:hypothetical protein [Bacteroidales bacterium]